MRFRTLILLLALFFTIAHSGDDKSNVRGLGMAGATTATSRTIDAIGINPALLAYMGIAKGSEIKGRIIDAETKQPVPGAQITIKKLNLTSRANFSGEFSIKNVPPGNYVVIVTQKGYETLVINKFRVNANSVISGTIKISRKETKEEKTIDFSEIGFDIKEQKPIIYNDNSGFTLSLIPQIGVGVGMNFLSYNLYLDYFTGVDSAGEKVPKHLTDADKRKILDSFRENPGTLMSQVDVKILSIAFSIKRIGVALGMRERIISKFGIPREFMEFALYGNPPGSVYSYNLGINGTWMREFSASFGTKLPVDLIAVKNINVGIGVKYIQGFGYVGTDKLNFTFETADSSRGYEITAKMSGLIKRAGVDFLDPDKEANFKPFPTPAGTGIGFDIGASAEILGLFTAGISITDIGSVNWTKNAVITSGDTMFKFTGYTTQEKLDSLRESFENYVKSPDRKKYESFSTGLPTAIRFGVATDLKIFLPFFPGRMLISADYFQPIGNEQISFKSPKFALGLEWRLINLLPLRAGISLGGFEGFALSVGTGINLPFLEFNIATGHLNEVMAGGDLRHFSVATELRLKF
ncbi:Carboxypeptidase regulatory-like domain-containing protein [Candidatus Kryptobacter tengchongensis]|nr:Carboxypeptidase regulatory-like domain-containing protein [Candidatus Kryptobacter tengchongensis]